MRTEEEIHAIATAYAALTNVLEGLDDEGDVIIENFKWDDITNAISSLENAFPDIIEERQTDDEYPEGWDGDAEALASAGRGLDEDYQPGEHL